MKAAGWLRLAGIVALLTVGCGSVTPTAAKLTPTPTVIVSSDPSPVATSSPTPRSTPRSTPKASPKPAPNPCPAVPFTSPIAWNPNLALVTLRGSSCVVVRDVSDINHPRTISILGPDLQAQFVSATTLSYVDAKRGLLRTPLSGAPRTPIAGGATWYFTWSPDGKTAAYLSSGATGSQPPMQLHLVNGGKDRIVSTMPGLPSVFGCESQTCADNTDVHLSYSPDGHFITWAQNLTDVFRMWTASGIDVTPKTPFVQKTVWSGQTFYFQDTQGIDLLRNGVVSSFLPGVTWIRPKASPDGGQIVYGTRDASGVSRTYLVDTTTAKVRELGGAYRAGPAFLTDRFIWYKGERACNQNECVPGSAVPTGKTYIYDLLTGSETESIIDQVIDIWPHPA
jgi:WD40-like Beta Propeller Repeat